MIRCTKREKSKSTSFESKPLFLNFCARTLINMPNTFTCRAFDTAGNGEEEPYLPESILWRQKEQFSDGVGYSWIDSLKVEAEHKVSEKEYANRSSRWPEDTPQTKEAYWYRELFEVCFPQKACTESVVRWVPRVDWGCSTDPSGRAQKSHNQAYDPTTMDHVQVKVLSNGGA